MYKVIANVWNYSPFWKNYILIIFLFGSLKFFGSVELYEEEHKNESKEVINVAISRSFTNILEKEKKTK